jgi:predicted AlkP superfamily pyrophosphatase or phosphodiesterase
MRLKLVAAFLSFALGLAPAPLVPSAAISPAKSENRLKLVVISIDGLDARYLREADRLHLKIPTLRKLTKQGASSIGVIGVLPDDSWATGTTMVTGVRPARHGVSGARSPNQIPGVGTLWQAVTAEHRKTALLYWPATVGAEADYNCPQFWEGAQAADLPFDAISQKCTPGLVQRISSVYPIFSKSQWNDSTALLGLRYLLQFEQPDLSLVHIADLDQEEHETGALSLYSREVLENQDEMIGQALSRLPPHTQVAVVSDHGFETEDFVVRPRVLIGSKTVEVREGLIGARTASDAAALRKLVGSRKAGIAREISLEEARRAVPEASRWTAVFATLPNYVASESATGKGVGPGTHKGVHAFWPNRPNFRSVFLLAGDGVRPVQLPEISMLQIAPTLADVLGVKLPAAEAASLWPAIKR